MRHFNSRVLTIPTEASPVTDPLPGLAVEAVPVRLAAAGDHVLVLIMRGDVPAEVAAECRRCHTSPLTLAAVLAAVGGVATRDPDTDEYAFTGYLKDLVRPGLCYSSIRRAFKAARRLELLVGVASDPYVDETTGRWSRAHATYAQRLPGWAGSCRRWRRDRSSTPRGPSGPITRVLPARPSFTPDRDAQAERVTVPDLAVDNGDGRRLPLPVDYLAARAAVNEHRGTRRRR